DARATEISKAMLGNIERCLVTGPAKKGEGMLSARTDNNRVVTFEGGPRLIGQMVNIEITDVFPHTLGGRLVK
ncbi:TRAM domain-containing protein, partial [Duodenibacillus massiliensis]